MAKKLKIYNGSSWEDVTFAITPPNTAVTNTFNTNQVIDASTSVAALRVTQRGTGEAFRVEDDTNPDSSPFVINASGNVGIGTASPSDKLHVVGEISTQAIHSSANNDSLELYVSGTFNTNGDAAISLRGTQSGYNNGGMEFYAGGSEKMRITSDGNVGVGINNPIFRLQTYNENASATVGSQALVFQAQIAGGNNDFLKLYSERTLTGGVSWGTQDWILRRHVDATPMGGIKWGAGEWNPTAFYGAPTSQSIRTTYISTGTPSGGIDGDMWATYV